MENNKPMTAEEKDLNYWRKNAEEDYIKVPISVLRYITELESAVQSAQQQPNKRIYGYPCVIDNELVFVVAKNIADCLDKLKAIANGKPYAMERNTSHRIIDYTSQQQPEDSYVGKKVQFDSYDQKRTILNGVIEEALNDGKNIFFKIKASHQTPNYLFYRNLNEVTFMDS